MEKEFVTYELAVKLKELGFKFKAFAYYSTLLNKELFLHSGDIPAPLWQQAFDWFRNEYNLGYSIHPITLESFVTNINNTDLILLGDFKTYEEARLECLNKLIKLVQNEL